jgi:hypothetical protein
VCASTLNHVATQRRRYAAPYYTRRVSDADAFCFFFRRRFFRRLQTRVDTAR